MRLSRPLRNGRLRKCRARHFAPGGAPDGQSEFCLRHARAGVAKAEDTGVRLRHASGRRKGVGGGHGDGPLNEQVGELTMDLDFLREMARLCLHRCHIHEKLR